ncbi:CCN family member 1-like [Lampris incognitus]|uniref:CCN family member 1-like n=1 Tax=Lampris incognitus TaxID=2546036 RepID=UPI0024B4DB2B|nr:CCN family member 1-like [Lampris incognitus]
MRTASLIVLLGGILELVLARCPQECRCPSEAPRCVPGVSLVPDGCGCCRVCARQLNEDCSKTEPCDHAKGLECNFGAGYGTAKGICRAKSDGRTCEYNNKIYQNGESFRPNCKHQCTCMDGGVGCVSLCQHEVTLPKQGCAKPRLLKVPGRCCDQLVCLKESKAGSSQAEKSSQQQQHRGVSQSEDYLTNENELLPMGGSAPIRSLPAFVREPASHMSSRGRMCVLQTTAWSPCSKSCGTGLSTRRSNRNGQCKLMKETRICEVRPCTRVTFTSSKRGQQCKGIEKASHPVKLSHAGCHSLKKFRPRYCGACADGRCCSPHQTRTVPVRFRCEDGETFNKNVMMIQSCKCDLSCPHTNNELLPSIDPYMTSTNRGAKKTLT